MKYTTMIFGGLLLIGGGLFALNSAGLISMPKLDAAMLPQIGVPKPTAKLTETPPPTVSVTRVALSDFTETITLTGTLVAREEVLVGSEIEGLRIVDVRVEEGMLIKKGDVLAVLETATLDAQLAQNDASLAKAKASIAQANSNIVVAEARQVEARNAYQRAKPLRDSGVVAESTMDQRETAKLTADAQLVAARDALKVSQAELAMIEAQRRDLSWRRSKSDLRAPMDGLVSRRNAKIGALASGAGEPMFRLIANGEIELDAEVPEVQLARLKAGQKATVVIAGIGEVGGKVRIISPEIDRTSRLGRVRILIDTMAAPRVGSFARASVATATGRGLAVPASAVQFAPEGAIVQLVVDDRVVSRRVITGLQSGDVIEIREGVAVGDVVVARAGTFVRDGDAVRPVPAQPGKLSEVK